MTDKINADRMLSLIFETIEGVKNINDPEASDCEKITVEQAKAINSLAKTSVEIYKVKAHVLRTIADISSAETIHKQLEMLGIGE